MIQCLLIEQNEGSFKEIRDVLYSFPSVSICGEAMDKEKANEIIKKTNPDVILSSTRFSDGTETFQFLNQKKLEKNRHLIFISTDEKDALKAIKCSAVDYLIKPLHREKVNTALEKVFHKELENEFYKTEIQNLIGSISKKTNKIAVQQKRTTEIIDIDKIIYLHADVNYCHIHLENDKPILVSSPLKKIEKKLIRYDNFSRVHQSFLINKNYIRRIIKSKLPQIMMKNGDVISIARSKKREFFNSLDW